MFRPWFSDSESLKKPYGCSVCFSCHGALDKGPDGWQVDNSGDKVHEPISGCQATVLLSLLGKQDLSRQQDRGSRFAWRRWWWWLCVRLCVCVCACVLGHVSAHPRIVFAWAVDCVWFTRLGCFNVALSVWVFSYRGWGNLRDLCNTANVKRACSDPEAVWMNWGPRLFVE